MSMAPAARARAINAVGAKRSKHQPACVAAPTGHCDGAHMGLCPTRGKALGSNDGAVLFLISQPSGAPMARTPTSRGAAFKSPSALPSSTQSETFRGNAGELQQRAGGKHQC